MANALAAETSPYLRQHQDNPVDWLPWGASALGRARDEDKPLLVSIGYSACHWCHVMERESFEDPEVAPPDERALRLREGRPRGAARRRRDLHGGGAGDDRPRRLAAQRLLHARPGAVLRRDLLPARRRARACRPGRRCSRRSPRRGRPGATRSASRATRSPSAWAARRCWSPRASRSRPPSLDEAVEHAARPVRLDPGRLRRRAEVPAVLGARASCSRTASARCRLQTLRSMAGGGINDQIGGGFARYAVDSTWTVPHFEKMLYDNALLARAYLHGVARERRPRAAPDVRGDARVRPARAARPGGRLLLRARRRLRGRGGQVLRLVVRRASSTRSSRPTPRRRSSGSAPPHRATSRARTSSSPAARSPRPSSARGSGSG